MLPRARMGKGGPGWTGMAVTDGRCPLKCPPHYFDRTEDLVTRHNICVGKGCIAR